MMNNCCETCNTAIENGKCSCGLWKTVEHMKDSAILLALEEFHNKQIHMTTAYIPEVECGAIFFKANYNEFRKLEEFICKFKGLISDAQT